MTTNPPKPEVKLLYNGKDCTNDFSKYLNSVTYREFEDNEADELVLSLNNNDGYFTDLWYPSKGDKLTCSIIYGNDIFDCGTLTIDENSFNFGTGGDTLEIKAVSTPKEVPIKTKKVKNHTGKTLVAIAKDIGKKQGFSVTGKEGFIKVGNVVQKNESDLTFLKRISKEYGYTFNIKNKLLTFTNKSDLWTNGSILTIGKTDIRSLSLEDSFTNVYGKVKVQYMDLKKKKLMTYTAVGNPNISDERIIYKRCSSLEEAKKVANAALNNNDHEITGRIELKVPLNNFIAGVNINLTGIGKFEGKYHIKSADRNVTKSGYTVTGEIVKC